MSLVTPIQYGIAGLRGHQHRFSPRLLHTHLDKQVLLLLSSSLPARTGSFMRLLARNARAVCALRLETVMVYARFMRIETLCGRCGRIQGVFTHGENEEEQKLS